MTQTKTDRQNAAKKATATRQGNQAADSFTQAKKSATTAVGHVRSAAEFASDAVVLTAKSVASRAQAVIPGS